MMWGYCGDGVGTAWGQCGDGGMDRIGLTDSCNIYCFRYGTDFYGNIDFGKT